MHKLKHWFNQNRATFWKIILVIVIFIGLVQLMNFLVKNSSNNQLNIAMQNIANTTNTENNSVNENLTTSASDTTQNSLDNERSQLTGDLLTGEQISNAKIIDDFYNYCNTQDVESAYNLLTDECKEEMYPSIDNFRDSYYNELFSNGQRKISIENWINNTYKVTIMDDYLSTGKYSKENNVQDYVTIVQKGDDYKLNINNYIGRTDINASKETDNVEVAVLQENSYMDYQSYKIQITNNTTHVILLDDGLTTSGMYIEDQNGIDYDAYVQEINEDSLKVNPGEQKVLTIRYYSKYSSEKTITKLVFSRVAMNYYTYNKLINKEDYNDYGYLEVDFN